MIFVRMRQLSELCPTSSMVWRAGIAFLGAFVLVWSSVASAAAPQYMNLQAYVTDSGGIPIDGNRVVVFSIFDDPTAGVPADAIWSETQTILITKGQLDATLGVLTPLSDMVFNTANLWIDIGIASESLITPRVMLTTVPFAFRTSTIDGSTGGTISGDVQIAGTMTLNSLQLITAPADGYVLTSDASGNASWQLPSASVAGSVDGLFEVQEAGVTKIELDAYDDVNSSYLAMYASHPLPTLELDAREGSGSDGGSVMRLWNPVDSNFPRVVVSAGDATDGGSVLVKRGGVDLGQLDVSTGAEPSGRLYLRDNAGSNAVRILANAVSSAGSPQLTMWSADGSIATLEMLGSVAGASSGSAMRLRDSAGRTSFEVVAEASSGGATQTLRNASGASTIVLDGDRNSNPGHGSLLIYDSASDLPTIDALASQVSYGGGHLQIRDTGIAANAHVTVDIKGKQGDEGGGSISLSNRVGQETLLLDGDSAIVGSENHARILLKNTAGDEVIDISGASGQIKTQVLVLTGGADFSEKFDVGEFDDVVQPGMVLSIDERAPGRLAVSSQAYDRKVAGVVSGAGGVAPGMVMSHEGTLADGEHPVALSGRVYVLADASNGPIRPGDLLTTSNVRGHAMKAFDHARSQGAILGKAMTQLEAGRGLVLTLVALQ